MESELRMRVQFSINIHKCMYLNACTHSREYKYKCTDIQMHSSTMQTAQMHPYIKRETQKEIEITRVVGKLG